jgi:1-acyl-sn-glycerol-3-phosphate acyltransferase
MPINGHLENYTVLNFVFALRRKGLLQSPSDFLVKPATLLKILRTTFNLLCKVEITGIENVPPEGTGAILAVNHLGLIDPPLGYVAVNRPDATAWVADKHKKAALYAFVVNTIGGIWIDREGVDLQALRKALQVIKEGRIFGVAPEGTRSPTGALIPAKEGVSYLATSSGAPVIPCAITGTNKLAYHWSRLRRAPVTVRIGKPFKLPPVDRTKRQQDLARGTDEIMCQIAALLPTQYWGVYADHPRLKELLAT